MDHNKKATLLLKLDMKKAFNSVHWDYLLELHRRKGFPTRFTDMLVALLCSATLRPCSMVCWEIPFNTVGAFSRVTLCRCFSLSWQLIQSITTSPLPISVAFCTPLAGDSLASALPCMLTPPPFLSPPLRRIANTSPPYLSASVRLPV